MICYMLIQFFIIAFNGRNRAMEDLDGRTSAEHILYLTCRCPSTFFWLICGYCFFFNNKCICVLLVFFLVSQHSSWLLAFVILELTL